MIQTFFESDEGFGFPEDSELPVLVLTTEEEHTFKSDEWQKLRHHTAGHACHSHEFYALHLPLRSGLEAGAQAITNHYYYSGLTVPSIDDLRSYQALLKEHLGARVNSNYEPFQEAIYPIDTSEARKLTIRELPEDLNELIEWPEPEGRLSAMFQRARFRLFLLGKNCD